MMGLEYDKDHRRWIVRCDAPNCQREYSCSSSYVNHDRRFISKELRQLGWSVDMNDGVPVFACFRHS